MSKKEQLENLAAFIGLQAAHEILIKFTNIPESIPHLQQEAGTYSGKTIELAKGNWNSRDIEMIKELAIKKCNNKLEKYGDIGKQKFDQVEEIIENIIVGLELI